MASAITSLSNSEFLDFNMDLAISTADRSTGEDGLADFAGEILSALAIGLPTAKDAPRAAAAADEKRPSSNELSHKSIMSSNLILIFPYFAFEIW
jgi:hypothetical protein